MGALLLQLRNSMQRFHCAEIFPRELFGLLTTPNQPKHATCQTHLQQGADDSHQVLCPLQIPQQSRHLYHLRVPQRWPERQDEAERAAFLEELHLLQQDPNVELWYGDECGIEGDPRPRRRWSARG